MFSFLKNWCLGLPTFLSHLHLQYYIAQSCIFWCILGATSQSFLTSLRRTRMPLVQSCPLEREAYVYVPNTSLNSISKRIKFWKKKFSFLFNHTNVGIYLEVSRTIYLSVVVYLPIYLNESNKVIFNRMMYVLPARMEHTLEHSQAFCIFPKELGGS